MRALLNKARISSNLQPVFCLPVKVALVPSTSSLSQGFQTAQAFIETHKQFGP
jgi:hypothetical protein